MVFTLLQLLAVVVAGKVVTVTAEQTITAQATVAVDLTLLQAALTQYIQVTFFQ
jgi:hypothetical protein